MEKDISTERKLRTVSVFLLLSAVLAAILSSFFPQLSLVSFACAAVFLMTLCSEQSGRVVMMLFALLVVPLPAVMTAGDGSAVLSISSVLFSSAAAVRRLPPGTSGKRRQRCLRERVREARDKA